MNIRIGNGFDVHAFGPGDHVPLAGVWVPHDRGVEAHSDGDVLVHALCDALLGAAGLEDIGQHFPPTEERWRGASGEVLLNEVTALLAAHKLSVVNIDLTLIAQRPRIAEHRAAMVENLAAWLKLAPGCVNIKATTTDKLGFTGRAEGIAALASVLLRASDS